MLISIKYSSGYGRRVPEVTNEELSVHFNKLFRAVEKMHADTEVTGVNIPESIGLTAGLR